MVELFHSVATMLVHKFAQIQPLSLPPLPSSTSTSTVLLASSSASSPSSSATSGVTPFPAKSSTSTSVVSAQKANTALSASVGASATSSSSTPKPHEGKSAIKAYSKKKGVVCSSDDLGVKPGRSLFDFNGKNLSKSKAKKKEEESKHRELLQHHRRTSEDLYQSDNGMKQAWIHAQPSLQPQSAAIATVLSPLSSSQQQQQASIKGSTNPNSSICLDPEEIILSGLMEKGGQGQVFEGSYQGTPICAKVMMDGNAPRPFFLLLPYYYDHFIIITASD